MSKSGSFSDFNSLLDKATSPMQLEPDIESVNKICYAIDKGVVESAYAIQALYGKMTDENPHTILFAFKVLEKIFYECGNLAHGVICTDNFMGLLKEIVETTEHKLIRDKILELIQTWTNIFKNFPQYSAPEKLLRNLQSEGYVFPGFENNLQHESKKQEHSISAAVKSLRRQIDIVKQEDSKNNYCHNRNSSFDSDYDKKNREDYFTKMMKEVQEQNNSDAEYDKKNREDYLMKTMKEVQEKKNSDADYDMKTREDDFIKTLKEVQENKKKEYKLFQKSQGLPTSSDEEEIVILEKEKPEISPREIFARSYNLHPELKLVKESRIAMEKELQEYRNSRKEEFKIKSNDENGNSNGMLMLRNPNEPCTVCEKFKKKCTHNDTFERSIPRLHPELRKVKESRAVIQNSFEQIKKEKQQAYYGKKSSGWIDCSSFKSYRNKDSCEAENEELQRALKLSEVDTNSLNLRKPKTRLGVMEEQKALEEALRLSLLDAEPNHSSEDDELQRAINMSIADADEENFSAFPKFDNNDDESVLLSYITELSLEDQAESDEKERKLTEICSEYEIIEPCVICRCEKRCLKSFKPCNHRCICESCSKKYTAQICPLCRAYYTSITF